jgi:hypothetical protein
VGDAGVEEIGAGGGMDAGVEAGEASEAGEAV